MFAADYPFRVDHDILVNLAADKCPGLAGCPKLVFVQVRVERNWHPKKGQNSFSLLEILKILTECFVFRRVKVRPQTRAAV